MTSALVTSVLQLVVGEQPSPGLVEAVTSLVDTTVRPHPAQSLLVLQKVPSEGRRFVITEKAPTRAFSWLKAATAAFTFKTLC